MSLEVEVASPSPYRLPRYGSEDGVMRVEGGVVTRLLHVEGCPVLTRAWEPGKGRVALRAEPLDPGAIAAPRALAAAPTGEAGEAELELALERMRFALGVDDDLGEFFRRFRRDPLLGPLLRRRPYLRPRRQPWPWEALAWAVVKQLIETGRAARIQRRMVGRWGRRLGDGRDGLRDVPTPDLIAGRAPVELESMGLALRRAIALRAIAADIAGGRPPFALPARDRPLDGAVPRPLRPRRSRLASRRGPDVPEAGRTAGPSRPPRDDRGGRGVLRPLRALPRSRGRLDYRVLEVRKRPNSSGRSRRR